MPVEGESDTIEKMLSDLSGDAGTQSEDSGYSEQNVPTELLAPSKDGVPSQGAEGREAKGAPSGKKSTPPGSHDWEKRYRAARPELDRVKSKMSVLEEIIKGPEIQKLAQTNPQIRQALAKAGYELAQEQEREAAGEKEPQPWELEVATLREELILDRQLTGLSRQIGRDLAREELMEILDVKKHIGGLSVEQAWNLTPSFRKHLKAAEEKRFDEFKKKNIPARPKPPVPLMPGQTLDMKKAVTEMNDAERQEKIAEILARTQGA